MKRRFELYAGLVTALGMCLLIFDGKTALEGAREGVQLCLYTLIPTLLPFFFLSNILTGILMGRRIRFLQPLTLLCKIPRGGEYIFLIGLLGGYPLGAQCISRACDAGVLSRQDGRRMMAFCNNCGPAFIFGVSGALFHNPLIPWLLFFIHLGSAVLTALFIPGQAEECRLIKTNKPSMVQSMWQALRSMAAVCGWVILFRVAISVAERWILWYIPSYMRVAFRGVLELSNGCISLHSIANTQLRLILCAAFLSFGGLCVAMQTYSAVRKVDMDLYFPGKVLQTLFSVFIACLICAPKWAVFPGILAVITVVFLRKRENRCRNSEILVV